MTSLSWLKLCSDILAQRKIAELLDMTRESCHRLVLSSLWSHQLPFSRLKATGSGNSELLAGPADSSVVSQHGAFPESLPEVPFPKRLLITLLAPSRVWSSEKDQTQCRTWEAITKRLSVPFHDAPSFPGNADDSFYCIHYLGFSNSTNENEFAFI